MKKRFLGTLLAVALVLSVMAVTVFAANYQGIKTPQIMYDANGDGDYTDEGDYASQTVTTDKNSTILPKEVTSEVSVSKVEGTQITLSGVVQNMKYSLNGGTAVTMKAADIVGGEYVITGLEEGVTYSIALTYQVRSKWDGTNNYMFVASDAIEVKTLSFEDGGKWPTPEGLATKNGVITGLVDGQTYMYAPVTLPAGTVGAYAEYTGATLANGVYSVYIAAGNDGQYKYTDSDPVAVLVEGDRVGKLSYTDNSVSSATEGAGKWTIVSPLGNTAPGYNKGVNGFASQISYGVAQDKFVAGAYTYTFLQSEYIDIQNIISFSFSKNNNQGDHIRYIDPDGEVPKNIKGAFILYVYGGEVDSYSIPFTWNAISSNSITVDIASAIDDDATGIVYKIAIDLVDTTSSNVTVTNKATLDEALAALNLRTAIEGNGYDELGGRSVSVAAGEFLYYTSWPTTARPCVAATGEILKNPDGSIKLYTEGYELQEGEFVALYAEDFSTTSFRDGIKCIATGCTAKKNGTITAYDDEYTYQQLQFTGYLDENKQNISYSVRKPEVKPDYVYFEGNGTVEGDETTNKYLIKGLDDTKVYMIAIGNGAYTKVENVTEYEVTGKKGVATKYSIYVAGGAISFDSEVYTKTITDAFHAIPDELTIETETDNTSNTHYYVVGFNEAVENNLTVEFIAQGESWDDSSKATAQNRVEVKNGESYYFRYASTGNIASGASVNIFVLYQTPDNELKGSVSTNYDDTVRTFSTGKWVYNSNKIYQDGKNRFASSWTPNLETADDIAWLYKFTSDEMVELASVSSFNLAYMNFANGNPFNTSTYNGYARIHVVNGDKSYYDIPVVIEYGKPFTVDVAAFWASDVAADESFQPKGYVSAIEIHYFTTEGIQGVEIVAPAPNYPVLRPLGWVFTENGAETNRSYEFVTLKSTPSLDDVSFAPAIGDPATGGYGGEIINLNGSADYHIVKVDPANHKPTGEYEVITDGVTYVPGLKAGTYAIRSYALATDKNFVTSEFVYITITETQPDGRTSAKMDKIVLPEDVVSTGADYTFDINESRWINRLALSNIIHESPNAVITFAANDYKYVIEAANIDLSLDTAHYFDMKVTFDGESAYDRMYSKMAAVADEKELIKGIHFETSTNYFFENASFMVRLGSQYDGYEVELRSFNDRVNRLRSEETVTVEDGWATFSTFGGDYVVLSPAYAADNQ